MSGGRLKRKQIEAIFQASICFYLVGIGVLITSVAGLGLNPDDVMINGNVTVDAFNASDAGNATQNFWRSDADQHHSEHRDHLPVA